MTPLETLCAGALIAVDGARACGVVDLQTGALLAGSGPASGALVPAVAAGSKLLLQPAALAPFEALAHAARPAEPADAKGAQTHEVHVCSPTAEHLFHLLRGGQGVLVLLADKSANIAMAWAQLKAVAPKMEAALARPL